MPSSLHYKRRACACGFQPANDSTSSASQNTSAKTMAAQADAEMEEYNSASDEDFNPAAGTHASDVSSSEDEDGIPTVTKAPRKKRKTRSATPDLVLDSGDEATIQERRGKKRRAGSVKGDTLPSSEDEGGEGGLIKTRAQRRLE